MSVDRPFDTYLTTSGIAKCTKLCIPTLTRRLTEPWDQLLKQPTFLNTEQHLTPENEHLEGDANSIDPDHGNLEVKP